MPLCPTCQQPASKRNGRDPRGRQKYACRSCRRTCTESTTSTFSGYRWPADVILTAVRWYLAYPLSSRQVLELLAERGIDVSRRAILDWVQAFGPTGVIPTEVVTDRHQPYIKAVAATCPGARHIRSGLHRARGETNQSR